MCARGDLGPALHTCLCLLGGDEAQAPVRQAPAVLVLREWSRKASFYFCITLNYLLKATVQVFPCEAHTDTILNLVSF